tara:strand:- start:689 stop:1357 length:669 start_codon:yes stop_codon:yes gene_type:complete
MARLGEATHGSLIRNFPAEVWQGEAGIGKARLGKAGQGKARSIKMTQSTPEQFIHWFREAMNYQLGVRYSPDWKKDTARARELLQDFGEDTLKQMSRALIEDPDEFSRSKTGVSIQRLYARRNHLAQSLVKPKMSVACGGPKLTLEQVDWRIKYIEDMLDKPTMGPEHPYSPKREDYLKLHDYYTRMRPRAEAESNAQKEKWGVVDQDPDPTAAIAEQMRSD